MGFLYSLVMPKNTNRSDIAIFLLVFGAFALVVLLFLAFDGIERLLGGALFIMGVVAIVLARPVSDAKQAIGERIPLWPGRNTLRPFTVKLWGAGLAIIGLMCLFGL
jgi:hypothetical protein